MCALSNVSESRSELKFALADYSSTTRRSEWQMESTRKRLRGGHSKRERENQTHMCRSANQATAVMNSSETKYYQKSNHIFTTGNTAPFLHRLFVLNGFFPWYGKALGFLSVSSWEIFRVRVRELSLFCFIAKIHVLGGKDISNSKVKEVKIEGKIEQHNQCWWLWIKTAENDCSSLKG